MNTNTNTNIVTRNPFDVLREMPQLEYEVTDSAVLAALTTFKSAQVELPRTKNGDEMSNELLVAMGSAARVARAVDSGLERLSYLIGASVVSREWADLYPMVHKDGELVQRSKPFKNQSEFIAYMLPGTAHSTALNYVSAVTNVLLPARMGQLPELPECATMSVGMASNIKSAIADSELKPHLVKAVNELHKAKGAKDAPLTRNEWKSAIASAKEAAGKTKPRDTGNVTGLNAESTPVTGKAVSTFYALSAIMHTTVGVQADTIRMSAQDVDKFRTIVNRLYNEGTAEDACSFVEALAGVLNGEPVE